MVRLEDADDRRCDDDYVVNRDDRWSMMVILRRLPGVALVGVRKRLLWWWFFCEVVVALFTIYDEDEKRVG